MRGQRRGMRRGLAGSAVTVAIVAIAGCGPSEQPAAVVEKSAPLEVQTVSVALRNTSERLEVGGLVAASQSAIVSSRVLAPIVEVRVRAGDRVRTGDTLVVLDDRDLAAQARAAESAVSAAEQALRAAQAERDSAEADATLASAWHQRIASLHARNSATSQELDEAVARSASATARVAAASARIEQATAQLDTARAALEAAQTVRSFATLRAPFDALVTERLADPGTLATPGMPILHLDTAGSRKVEAQVDAARAPYIQAGDRVDVLIDGHTGAVQGVVTQISRAVTPGSRTFTVDVTLPAGVEARTGTFARVRFEGPARETLVVPVDAIRRQGQVASVFVVAEDGVARLRLVQTGAETEAGIEVLAGLTPGERVVTNAPAGLVDGSPVVLPGAATAERGRP